MNLFSRLFKKRCRCCGKVVPERIGFSIPNSHQPAVIYVCKDCWNNMWRAYYGNTKQEVGKE